MLSSKGAVMILLSVGLVVMSVGVVMVVVGAAHWKDVGGQVTFLRIGATAAVVSLGAITAHLMAYSNSDRVLATTANTAMVMAPALVCVAVSIGDAARTRAVIVFTAIAGVSVSVSTAVLPEHEELIVRSLVMAAVCATCAILATGNTGLPRLTVRLLFVATSSYAAYSVARVTALVALGPDGTLTEALFHETQAVAMALMTQLFVCAAIITVAVPAAQRARRRMPTVATVIVSDWPLVVDAYGWGRAIEMVKELRMAARELDPFSSIVPPGVSTTLPAPMRVLPTVLTFEYGWAADETALLITTGEDLADPQEHGALDIDIDWITSRAFPLPENGPAPSPVVASALLAPRPMQNIVRRLGRRRSPRAEVASSGHR